MKSKTSIEIENIERAFLSPVSLVDIQKALDYLSQADSALQIGTKNETIMQAQKYIQKAFMLLSERKKGNVANSDNFKAKITSQ